MEESVLLRMQHVTKRFPAVIALNDVEFTLKTGEIHALLGENGAGKSTLIKVLTGVEHMDEGETLLEGKRVSFRTPHEAQHAGISTVYQEVNLCPHLSVAENIYIGREPMKHGRIDWKQVNRRAEELIRSFELNIDVTRKLDDYSVAVQQMVAIARAVDVNAKILILDEPTSSLSTAEVDKLFRIMRMLRERGMGIVFVTHFLNQVYEVCDTITVLRNGAYVGTWPVSELPRLELIGKMIGKEYAGLGSKLTAAEPEGDGEVLLEVEGGSTSEITDLSLRLRKGEVAGFSGLLGSGRSETARLIFGADPMNGGKMTISGKKVSLKSPLDAIRQNIAFCPEDRKAEGIVGDLSIRDNIILALQTKRGMTKAISFHEAEEIANRYIEELKIKTPGGDQLIRNLSGGNQQKVIVARWLATEPDLLILDEPTRGIDIGAKAEIQKIVVDLAEKGMSCVFISSEMEEMLRCCTRMFVLRDKELAAELTGAEITESHIMSYIAGEGGV